MTINKNFKSRPERLKYSISFSLSGLDLKLLFMVTGAYYESGLYLLRLADFMTVISSLMEAVCVAWNLKTFEALTE